MDNLLSILVLNYYSTYIKANADMHYTITNINMTTPKNTNNYLHMVSICISVPILIHTCIYSCI